MVERLLWIAILECRFNIFIYFMAKLFYNDVLITMLLCVFFPENP